METPNCNERGWKFLVRKIFHWLSTAEVSFLNKNGPLQVSFYLFSFFIKLFLHNKIVIFSGIRTRIVVVDGEHADQLTTTTVPLTYVSSFSTSPLDSNSDGSPIDKGAPPKHQHVVVASSGCYPT